jgi:hypothetical protein
MFRLRTVPRVSGKELIDWDSGKGHNVQSLQGSGEKRRYYYWPLDQSVLCNEARRRTGLYDFGDPPLEPGLSVLVNSLEGEAELHCLGRFLIHQHLCSLLQTRLRLTEQWHQQRGKLNAAVISRPVFITGMPRSGSTFLHELLAQDPANRAPRVWEIMFPMPNRENSLNDRRLRIWKTAASLWFFRRLAPLADSVHPLRARTPHECIAIHSYTLLSEAFVTTCRVPSYERFLHSSDLSVAYHWQKQFLQHLQIERSDRAWILKSPDHVRSLGPLFAVFPDAWVVQTHRDPMKVLESSVRLVGVLQKTFSPKVNAEQILQHESQALAESIETSIHFRENHPEFANRFIDINYANLVADPIATVRGLYRALDRPLSAAALSRMERLAAGRGRYAWHKHFRMRPPSTCTPALPAFAQYCYKFGLISESS